MGAGVRGRRGARRRRLARDEGRQRLQRSASPYERAAGTADYVREVTPGTENGAYIRVVPRLGGGCVIAMTLPVRPGTMRGAVRETLAAELAAIERAPRR